MIKKYGVMIIDPPWKYSNRQNGAAEKHYPLMTYKELAAMPIPSVAADDSVLLMWATWPQLDVAMRLINDWGFNYVTGMPWIKLQEHPIADLFGNIEMVPTFGTGHWLRGCSEPILIARRGKPRLPNNVPLGLLSKRLKHTHASLRACMSMPSNLTARISKYSLDGRMTAGTYSVTRLPTV